MNKSVHLFLAILFMFAQSTFATQPTAAQNAQQILGKWINEDNSLVLEFYQKGESYFARIAWLQNNNDQLDSNNSNEKLKTRRLRGSDMVVNALFDPEKQQCNDGKLYDFERGTTYNCQIWLDAKQPDQLFIKGYGYFSVLGSTTTWKRPTQTHAVYKGH